MKDEKEKYLMVDAKEINKQLYEVTKIFLFNDFDSVYDPCGKITAKEIFEKNGVPEEYQKIIIKTHIPIFGRNKAEEYTMRIPFNIQSNKIKNQTEREFLAISSKRIQNSQVFERDISFSVVLNYSTFEEIIAFLKKVESKGYLKDYLKSIRSLFDVSLNLEKNEKSTNIRVKKKTNI